MADAEDQRSEREKIYDAEIAPRLREIRDMCQARGFPFVACVEWEVGAHGRTEFCPATKDPHCPEEVSFKQILVHWAARAHGNVDAMLRAVCGHARKRGHSSMYLHELGVPEAPDGAGPANDRPRGHEVFAIAVTTGGG